jgi:steroid 5-alpha reductase family enzyme
MGPIRFIFPAFVLAFWVICGLGIANGQWTGIHWLMLGIAHLGCAIIFVNFVHVFTYGYGLSMVLVNLGVMAWRPVPAVLLTAGLGVVYGLRLFWFVWSRDRSQGYAATREKSNKANAGVPMPLRLFMWVSCGWLMAFVGMPAWVAGAAGGLSTGILAGAALMLAGLVLEAVADQQKQAAKAANPGTFVTGGLYGRLRHPNYLGEIVFQAGLIVVAVAGALGAGLGGWAVAAGVAGPLYIAILMYYAARDQDHQQGQRYGADPAYQAWRNRTSCLLPGL